MKRARLWAARVLAAAARRLARPEDERSSAEPEEEVLVGAVASRSTTISPAGWEMIRQGAHVERQRVEDPEPAPKRGSIAERMRRST